MPVTLPALHTLITASSPPPSPSNNTRIVLPPITGKSQHDQLYTPASLPFPLSLKRAVYGDHRRRMSTCSMSSAPSLTHSPFPSPPPTRPPSPDSFLLVPCAFNVANAVVIIADQPETAQDSQPPNKPTASPRVASSTFRPCKPSEARATLLIGPAISAYARKNADSKERRMHPYRIVRERRGSREIVLGQLTA